MLQPICPLWQSFHVTTIPGILPIYCHGDSDGNRKLESTGNELGWFCYPPTCVRGHNFLNNNVLEDNCSFTPMAKYLLTGVGNLANSELPCRPNIKTQRRPHAENTTACFFSHCLRWSISNYKFCTSIMLTSRKEDLMYYKDNGRITIRWKQDVFGSTPATQATLTAIGLRMRLAPDWQYVSLFRSATLHVWCSFLSYVFTRLCLHYIKFMVTLIMFTLHVPGFTFLRQLRPWTRSAV